ncbi:MAG TPA: hypothetical protein DCO82_02260, partial [Alphaproteobacteria bacterium]|nr:hypothetical protein [Alphaproteobacteria bacterium]
LLALALSKGSEAAQILEASGATAENINRAINEIRKGRTADNPSAEDTFDALKKYAR